MEYDIIYEEIEQDLHTQNCIMYNAIWMKDATIRHERTISIEKANGKQPYIFLTINPNSHITLQEFIGVITKMMSKIWIEKYLYVYEQRGEDMGECGKGFHFHAIIKKPTNKCNAHILRELKSFGDKLCDTTNHHFFNLKYISEEEKDRKIVYLTGSKADTIKHKKQEMDIPFRVSNNLKSFYNIGIL